MVRVPTYERTETLRPAFRQDVDVRATPEAAGAAIGQGVQRIGAAVGQVAATVDAVQTFNNQNAARGVDTEFADWLREKAHGNGGFLTLEGKNAQDAYPKFVEEVEAKRREFGARLKPGASALYDQASRVRIQTAFQQAATHKGQQEKEYYRQTNDASRAGFANDALANFTDPALVQRNISAGLLTLVDRAEKEGMGGADGDWYKQEALKFTSGVHSGIAMRMIDANPMQADQYLKDNAASFLPAELEKVSRALEQPLRTAKTRSWLQSAIGALPPETDFAAPQNGNLLDAMVPITIHTESRGNPNAVSPKGARGRMQIMPGSGRDPGFGIRPWDGTDADNERFGRDYLGKMMERYNNDPKKAWAAYNWGPGNVDKAVRDYGASWLSRAPTETKNYVSQNIRMLGERGGAGSNTGTGGSVGAAGNTSGAWLATLYGKADAIADPDERDAAYAEIDRWYNRQQRVLSAGRDEVVNEVERRMLSDPSFDPSSLPVATQQVLGLSTMKTLQNTYDAKQTTGEIKTNLVVLDKLETWRAVDPDGFARADLTTFQPHLSTADFLKQRSYQTAAKADTSKAIREGKVFEDAYRAGEEFYQAAGIIAGNSAAANTEENQQKRAQYRASIREEVQQFITKEGRPPRYDEMRAITSALTMHIIGSERRTSSFTRLFDRDGLDDVTPEGTRLYQRGNLAPGLVVRPNVSYSHVPADMVGAIRQTLRSRLRKEPTNLEIAQEWGRVAQSIIGEN